MSAIETGHGGSHTLDAWQRIALASGRPLVVKLLRDPLEDPADAGHLAIQELVLRLGRAVGFGTTFELATRAAEPWRSTDVGLRDDRRRILLLIECWNTIGDLGAAARSTSRKVAEAEAYAVAIWGDQASTIASCWVVRATQRNRELVGRYREVFRSRFPGSSLGWIATLARGESPPANPGLVWCDVAASGLFAWRR